MPYFVDIIRGKIAERVAVLLTKCSNFISLTMATEDIAKMIEFSKDDSYGDFCIPVPRLQQGASVKGNPAAFAKELSEKVNAIWYCLLSLSCLY